MKQFFIPAEEFKILISKVGKIEELVRNGSSKTKPDLSALWLSITQVCKILQISTRTLYQYRLDGTLPYSQFQNKIYFKRSDVEAHLKRNYRSGDSSEERASK